MFKPDTLHNAVTGQPTLFEHILTGIGCLLFLMMVAVLIRVVRGPTAIDRIVGVNIIGTKTMLLLVFIGTLYGRVDMFVDLALTYALLNFVGSVAAAKYFRRKSHGATTPIHLDEEPLHTGELP